MVNFKIFGAFVPLLIGLSKVRADGCTVGLDNENILVIANCKFVNIIIRLMSLIIKYINKTFIM